MAMPAPATLQLRDIHVPAAPSWWPPAPGWWLLAAMICIGLAAAFIYLYKKWCRSQRRRAVLAEFDREVADAAREPVALAALLSGFMRRISLRSGDGGATLLGESWLAHLDALTDSRDFSTGPGRVLISAPFDARIAYEPAPLVALTRRALQCALRRDANV